ncbi:MAG TPA: metallophosphoesterase [Acidimicrobiia bacterium]|nr:metallophosphoesterase [Acidimicrobiia bacterium]
MGQTATKIDILAVADEVDEGLWHDVSPVQGVGLILACGDLPFEYLAHLAEHLNAPLVFVAGNHDPDIGGYRLGRSGLMLRAGLPDEPPWPPGAVNADGRVVDVAGLRVAGLGGSVRYGDGPNQYTQGQQRRRAARVVAAAHWRRWRDGRRVDVVLAHAPPRRPGDDGADRPGDPGDAAHTGFDALTRVMDRLEPRLLCHGHVHPYGGAQREQQWGPTTVRNVVGRHVFTIETEGADAS